MGDVAAAECEQLLGQPGGAFGGPAIWPRSLRRRPGLSVLDGRASTVSRQFGVVGDHREDVVEVVGHAAGELAEAFQPAGVLQAPFAGVAFGLGDQAFAFVLGDQPFGDVADGGGHDACPDRFPGRTG